ncbi:family 16 glycosylhydrolase [Sediminibacillus dalangtanensis]|uniref:licheninase n=1 Tax=Sediminibacillus dalangtanensis TaxID=2729421 RepID=A0ABX7VX57_9BACI|nr:family 16 glycosylhydrolase [Sediminibacillus dalangtanensis]
MSICFLVLFAIRLFSDQATVIVADTPYIRDAHSFELAGRVPVYIREAQIESAYAEKGWHLIWYDEFTDSGLDTDKWRTEDWASFKNEELQYYTPANVQVGDGRLRLISRKETYHDRRFTSGAVHTQSKFSFRYGKAEIRAKLPKGKGIFPAFWMLPDQEDKWLPEIDILEMLGHEPHKIWMVQHWLNGNEKLVSNSSTYTGDDFSAGFHTFSIEWSPGQIIWLIDGKERFRSSESVPGMKMYLYLNTAIGGVWPGDPDQTTELPQAFEVDYVRVFQKKGGVDRCC